MYTMDGAERTSLEFFCFNSTAIALNKRREGGREVWREEGG